MLRRALVIVLLAALAASCGGETESKPLSEPGEKLFELNGKIVSRDAGDNTLRIDHKEIPDFMSAMTMDFSVRGADVGTLPADGAQVVAKLHVTDRGYWLTEVRQAP
jgi:hypothetical protein